MSLSFVVSRKRIQFESLVILVILCVSCVCFIFGNAQANPQQFNRRRGFRFENNENQLPSSEQYIPGQGGTGISCTRPGRFVLAPDGCNRCFCESNSELSAACSRALCPPGFPSGNGRQNNIFNI